MFYVLLGFGLLLVVRVFWRAGGGPRRGRWRRRHIVHGQSREVDFQRAEGVRVVHRHGGQGLTGRCRLDRQHVMTAAPPPIPGCAVPLQTCMVAGSARVFTVDAAPIRHSRMLPPTLRSVLCVVPSLKVSTTVPTTAPWYQK